MSARASASVGRWAVVLVPLVIAVYWRAPLLGFAGDDALVIYHIKRLGGLANPWAFFTGLDFFTYYRPVGFLTFASDAAVWGWRPAGFHLTNLVLHGVNTLLVFALARRVLPSFASALAAALFAVHASNQEAVYWISARFDLLATSGVLATLLLATRRHPAWVAAGLGTFALALLSKESALAAPVLAGAYGVFVARWQPRRVVIVLTLMLVVIGCYSASRSLVGGLDPTGGTSRLPKAAALVAVVGGLMVVSRTGWARATRMVLNARPLPAATVAAVALAAAAVACMPSVAGVPFREKLSFAGFAGFYIFSPIVSPAPPPFFLDPGTPVYWAGGLAVVALVAAGLFPARARLMEDSTWLFLIVSTLGTLLPVSSLTEGSRYLYMASVPVAIGLAKLVVEAQGRWRRHAAAAAAAYLMVSVWQVQVKGADWAWATGMLSRTAAMVNADLPGCDEGDVVFLTAPVGIRGVYSHFYHQTFSQDGGCEPASFRAVARMVRIDQPIEVRWTSPRTLLVTASEYQGNFLLSADLRQFTIEQRSRRTARLSTPLGPVVSTPDAAAQHLVIELAPSVDLRTTRFYYFALGKVHRVYLPGEPGRGPLQ